VDFVEDLYLKLIDMSFMHAYNTYINTLKLLFYFGWLKGFIEHTLMEKLDEVKYIHPGSWIAYIVI